MTDEYHGYATESDYHEHYTLLAEIERSSDLLEIKEMLDRIDVILESRVYIESRYNRDVKISC